MWGASLGGRRPVSSEAKLVPRVPALTSGIAGLAYKSPQAVKSPLMPPKSVVPRDSAVQRKCVFG